MKRALLLLLLGRFIGGNAIYAGDAPSYGLMSGVFIDHFYRYHCISKFPEMREQIQRAYDESRLRYILVPCRKLQCSDPEQTEGMQVLLARARELPEDEHREACAAYPETVKAIEREHARELDALFPKRRTK